MAPAARVERQAAWPSEDIAVHGDTKESLPKPIWTGSIVGGEMMALPPRLSGLLVEASSPVSSRLVTPCTGKNFGDAHVACMVLDVPATHDLLSPVVGCG